MAQNCTFTARLDCHYVLDAPAPGEAGACLIAALHGYGQNAEVMLKLARSAAGPRHAIASIEGPYHFFARQEGLEVGYCWVTSRHAESSVRLHHDMVQHVLNDAGRQCGIPPERRILMGFSQPVGLNYRFAATCPGEVRGVAAFCGGLPGNWETGPYQRVTASVLHVARDRDEFYPPSVTETYAERLRLRAGDVEFHLLDGPHRFPSRVGPILDRWLERILR